MTSLLRYSYILLLLVVSLPTDAQTFDKSNAETCEFKLSKARALFEAGQLDKIPVLLGDCASDKELSKSMRLSVLKLLTESYLFLNDMDKANTIYQGILAIDPFFQPRTNVDHPELVYLSDKYVTTPTFSFGFKTGGNTTLVQTTKNYVFEDTVKSINESFENNVTYHAGFFINYQIPKSRLELMLEVLYSNTDYNYTGMIDTKVDGETAQLSFEETYTTLSFPISIKLNSPRNKPVKKPLSFYTYVGASLDILRTGRIEGVKLTIQRDNTIGSPGGLSGVDLISGNQTDMRNKTNFSIHCGLGVKYHIKRSQLFFDLRYSHTLKNIVNSENRYSNQNLLRFWHVDNDLKWHTLYLSIGYRYSLYKVRRK